ncbi:hypothetical protein MEQU1_000156 [Malassezia equina]|uniref:Ribosomal RNA-processing protein 42 n=1 Tax=Malassezia equina TaxID=1381935 RepID=A0AAF0IX57_9BASI|nr:hypothetical protein MEQU1_000156 [Malassezia equina]
MAPVALSRAERSYVLDGLCASPALRSDGRGLRDVRPIQLESSTSQQADGSARVVLGSTEVLCGIKAEVESYMSPHVGLEQEGASSQQRFAPWLPPSPRIEVLVEYSPALLHEHNATELAMITGTVQDMVQACFTPYGDKIGPFDARQFVVVPYAKFWRLYLDVYVLSWSGGNVLDAVFAAVFSALWDVRIPETQALSVDRASQGAPADATDPAGMKFLTRGRQATGSGAAGPTSGEAATQAVDFALTSEWDDGHTLYGREDVPVCISVYPVQGTFLLDPTLEEESALSSSVVVLASQSGRVYGVRQRGDASLSLSAIHEATEIGVYYARQLAQTLQGFLP